MNTEGRHTEMEAQKDLVDLFSAHRHQLERLVEFRLDQRLRSRVDSSDVLQEAYIEISKRYRTYLESPQVSFLIWARQITLQTLIDIQRNHFGQKRSPELEVRFGQNLSDDTSDSIIQMLSLQRSSPSGVAIRSEEIAQLQAALATMDETDREVLALRHFEYLSNSEVAEALGLSVTAASNRYIRAMSRLSEILRKFG